ncbi:MAG: PAS domain S-box protein [Tildeniella nuda ZEHNDER 1965/U140]|jgi:PAS domain S-box-containing protein|nr:PAS domain S-box protein [Tildeniella nuda ZEHNDER 1965/U140]
MQMQQTEVQKAAIDLPTATADLQALFAAMDDFIFVFDAQGYHLRTLPTRPTLLQPSSPSTAETPDQFVPPAQNPPFLDAIQQALETGEPVSLVYGLPVQTPEAFFEATITPHTDSSVLWVGRNVTKRRQSQDVLRKSEERYRSLLEATSQLIWHTTAEGTFATEQLSWTAFTGQPFSESQGWGWLKAIHPDDQEHTTTAWSKSIADRTLYKTEHRLRRYDGEYRYMSVCALAVPDPDGHICEWIGVHTDITERHEAETLLKKSEERFRSYFNLPLVGIAITSPAKGWLDVNDKACTMLGYTRDELIRLTWAELTNADDLVLDNQFFVQMLSGQIEQYAMDKRYVCKDGTTIYTHLGVGCVRKPDGSVDYTVALMQDITERKLAEEALRQSEAQLRTQTEELEETLRSQRQMQAQLVQSEKMSSLGQLVAGIAHEVNNPINFIHGNLTHVSNYIHDLLHLVAVYQQQYTQPTIDVQAAIAAIDLDFLMEDLPKVVASMKMGSDRIRQIVLSLRNFSRLDETGMKAVDIHEGIDNTLLILQSRLKVRAGKPSIQVVKDYGRLPLVDCYAGQLNQVFMNILANAIDALDEGSEMNVGTANANAPTCSLSPIIHLRTTLAGTEWVEIHITDNGEGMTENVRSRLFDPFFTTKPVGKGTGMGLAISYQIVVEKHSGQLECSSAPGKGTAFTIRIPTKQQK